MEAVILGNTRVGYSWFVQTFRQGLIRNGYPVDQIDFRSNSLQSIKNQLIAIKHKYVFTHLTFHESAHPISKTLQMYRDVNKAVGTRFVHTCNDARSQDRFMGDISGAIHMAFVGNLELLKNCPPVWKVPTYFAPYSSLCYDKMKKPSGDLMFRIPVFTGSVGAHGDRSQFINNLIKRIPIKIIQTQSKEDLRHRTAELSASAKCILGLCTGYDIDGYIDVRPFQYLGTGACMIIRKFKGMDNIIPEDLYYPIDSYDEKGINKTVSHWAEIKITDTLPMQLKAFNYIQQNHSCEVRLRYILQMLER